MEQLLFQYSRRNVRSFGGTDVRIFDRPADNVICCQNQDYRKPEEENRYTLDWVVLARLREILQNHGEMFRMISVESPLVMDGVVNEFYFAREGMENSVTAYNLWAFRSETDNDNVPHENADVLLSVYDEIFSLLTSHGIDGKYLSLKEGGTQS